jgi:hypothetical protein
MSKIEVTLGSVRGAGLVEADGRFSLTPPVEYLRSDVRGSMRNWAMVSPGPVWWSSWGELLHSVQTGEPALKVYLRRGEARLEVGDVRGADSDFLRAEELLPRPAWKQRALRCGLRRRRRHR